jgi:hypothetical protein
MGWALIVCTSCFILLIGCTKQGAREEVNTQSSDINNKSLAIASRENPFEFVIDQSNINLVNRNSYNILLGPLGQEFTPALYALDAVELQVEDASCSQTGNAGGMVKVQIREGSITGRILGISTTMEFVNCFSGIMKFDFPSFIPLVPGEKYVIEPVHVSGNTAVFYMDDGPSSQYPGGRYILYGTVQPGKDLWFREGLSHSIARTKDQVKLVGWQNLVRRDGTRFRNMGDCMQYINTGR